MNSNNTWMNRLALRMHEMDIHPGFPLIELVGDCRVLIENHCSIIEYGKEKITIRMKFGCVEICGSGMQLSQLTKSQLVISGKITGLQLIRRGS